MLWLLLAVACSHDATSTPGEGEGTDLQPSDLPTLQVSAPERAAFTGAGDVTVKGTAVAGSSPLSRLTLNGQDVSLKPGGEFSTRLSPEPGINILGLRVEDEGGQRAVDGRALLAGQVHAPGEWLQDAVHIQVGPSLLDDDDPDLDDAAGLAEALLSDDSLVASTIVGEDFPTDYVVLTPRSFSYSDASVDLTAGDGTLTASVTVTDLAMDFDAQGVGWYDWASTSGSAWATSATVTMVLDVAVHAGGVQVNVVSSTASLQGWGLTVDYFPDFLEGQLADWTQSTVEDAIASTAEDKVSGLVASFLESMAVDTTFGDPPLELALSLSGLDVTPEGLRLSLDGVVSADDGVGAAEGAGSLATHGAAPSWPTEDPAHPFWAAVDDDFVNQLLFAFWYSGALSDFRFSGVELGGLSGQPLPEPLGPANEVTLSLNLPPVVAAHTQDDMQADLELGELRLGIEREDGQRLDFSINVRDGMNVTFDDSGEIGVALDNRPAMMTLEVGTLQYPDGLDPGDLAALIRLIVPPLLGNASNFAPNFPLPQVPLDSLGLDGWSGLALRLDDPEFAVDPEGGWLELDGALNAVTAD